MSKELLQQALDALINAVPCTAAQAREQADAIVALRAALAQPVQPAESCIWTEDDPTFTPDTYASACGELWSFIDGGPAENNVRFCQGCGKPVQTAPQGEVK